MHKKVHYQISLSTTSAAAGVGTLLDLSIEGCRIECAGRISINTYLSLRLPLTHEEPQVLVDLAAVRWVRGTDCGIQFLSIQPPQLNRLEKFLAAVADADQPTKSSGR